MCIKRFKSEAAARRWMEGRYHRYQMVRLFVNSGYAVEYRKLRKLCIAGFAGLMLAGSLAPVRAQVLPPLKFANPMGEAQQSTRNWILEQQQENFARQQQQRQFNHDWQQPQFDDDDE